VTEPAQAPGAFFEQRYRRDPDPWQFATSPYEQRRYDITLASLPRQRYERAFEPGCSVGALTERLAARCGSLLAMDGAPTAVREARRRCAPQPHVEVCCGEVPTAWPAGGFDLILLSELATTSHARRWNTFSIGRSKAWILAGTWSQCTGGVRAPTTCCPETRSTASWLSPRAETAPRGKAPSSAKSPSSGKTPS
jgi:hypothetical protein